MTQAEFIINYGSKSCTLADYIQYKDVPARCPEFEKIGTIVYLQKEIAGYGINKSNIGMDTLMQEFHGKHPVPYLTMILTHYDIRNIPENVIDIIACEDEDERFDLLLQFLKDLKIN